MSISIGTIEGVIRLKNEMTAEIDKISAKLTAFDTRLKTLEDSTKRVSAKTKSETEKITESYKRVAASLDPTIAKSQKYEKTVEALDAALKKGVITQETYNKHLAQAHSKYIEAEHGGSKFHELLERITTIAGSSGRAGQEAAEKLEGFVGKASSLGGALASLGPTIAIVGSLAAAVVGLGVAFKAAEFGIEFLKESVVEGMKVQVIIDQLNNSLRTNGAAAGYSSAQLVKMAESLVVVTGREDEAILSGELILTRFNKIGHDTFPQATKAALDFAQATGRDLPSAFSAVGKLLQDAGRGLNTFKDIGITLLPSQRKTLQALLETGKTAEYQATVLGILKEKVDGAAEAYQHTLSGAIATARAEFSQFKEGIASEVIPALEFLVADLLNSVGGWEGLHESAEEAAHKIGNAVRELIFNTIINFHEWTAEIELTLARFLDSLRDFTAALSNTIIAVEYILNGLAEEIKDSFGDVISVLKVTIEVVKIAAKALTLLPGVGPNQNTSKVAKLQQEIDKGLADTSDSLRKSALGHVRASNLATEALKKHKLALEGDTKVYKDRGDTVEDVAKKESDAAKREAEHAKKIQERINQQIAEYKNAADNAQKRFALVGATDAAILKQEISEARLAAALKLGADATKAQIKQAQDAAEATVIWTHATRNQEQSLKDLDKVVSDRLNKTFEENVRLIAKGPEEAGLSISQSIVDSIFLNLKNRADEFAQGIRESLLTIADAYDIEKDKIKKAVDSGRLTAEEGAKAVSNLEQRRWDDALSIADQALGYLADRFGGFFKFLQDAINTVQGARSFGQSITQTIQAYTQKGSSLYNAAGAIGGVATVFAIYAAIYEGVQDHIKKARLKKFGQTNTFEIKNSIDSTNFWDNLETGRIDKWGRDFAKSISSLIRGLEDALGINVQTLAKISLQFRNDGKMIKAFVEGHYIGLFEDVNDAIKAAIKYALTDPHTLLTGISDLMREGLKVTRVADLEDLTNLLQSLREIGDLNLPQAAIQVRETIRHLDELFTTLSRLREVTPSVVEGFNNIVQAQAQTFLQWRNQITGHQETRQEMLTRLQNEAIIFNAEKALRIADLKYRASQLRIEADQLRIRAQIGTTGARIGGVILQNQIADLKVRNDIAKASATLVQSQLDMLEAMLKAIDDAIAALEGIPDIKIPDIKLPKIGGVGKGGAERDNVLEFIKGKQFDLAVSKLGEYARQVQEIIKQYDEQIAQTKIDSAQRRELLALKKEELKQLAEERAATVVSNFRQFLGLTNQFEDVRNTAADLIKQINDSPFGDARKARMIGRVLADLENQIDRMARESAASLLGELVSDLQKYGADSKLIIEAQKAQAILEHVLKLEHYKTEIEILKAQGKLSQEVLGILDKSLKTLEGIDPTKIIDAVIIHSLSGSELADAIKHDKEMVSGSLTDLADAIKSATDKLHKYQDDGLDPLTRDLVQITTDFADIRKVLGSTPEVLATESAAIQRALDSFLDPIKQLQHDLLYGEQSPLDTLSKWQQAQADFLNTQLRFRAGDLSVVKDIPDMVQQFLALAREVTPIGSQAYTDIFKSANLFLNEVLAITPDTLGTNNNPMNVAGMSDLNLLSEAQIERLDRIYASSERVADAITALNSSIRTSGSAAGVA